MKKENKDLCIDVFRIIKQSKNKKGKYIAITGRQIIDRLGIKLTGDQLRGIIKELRLQGKLIIAGKKGYWIANNQDELIDYLISREAELYSECVVITSMEKEVKYNGKAH